MTKTFAVLLARLMLRTARTPFGAVWSGAYHYVMRAAIAWILRQYRDASIYLKGSFASREPVYGISDIDLVVIVTGDDSDPGAVQLSARESWKRLGNRFPLFKLVIGHCWFYEEDDLRESASASCFTYGLSPISDEEDRAAFLGPRSLRDHMGLQTHPSLYGARDEWRSVAGRDRLPIAGPEDAQSRRLAAWLGLQYWWRHAFLACAEPRRVHVPLLCVKLIAEPVRLWLWAERGEHIETREAALRRGLSEMPEERELFQLALRLMNELPRSPNPPLDEVLAGLIRHSEMLALHMNAAAESAGYIDVKLTGVRNVSGDTRPLADWRARAVASMPDERMTLIQADDPDPDFIAGVARADGGDVIPAFRYNDILLMPTTNSERGILRSIQCQPADPVSFALADGHSVARFPELAGWSALHSARRAVAEHREWLESSSAMTLPHGWIGVRSRSSEKSARTLGPLFSAARAGLFLGSINDGDPELAVSIEGVAERLVERDSSCRETVETALDIFRAYQGSNTNEPALVPLLEIVRNLPAYASSSEPAMAMR